MPRGIQEPRINKNFTLQVSLSLFLSLSPHMHTYSLTHNVMRLIIFLLLVFRNLFGNMLRYSKDVASASQLIYLEICLYNSLLYLHPHWHWYLPMMHIRWVGLVGCAKKHELTWPANSNFGYMHRYLKIFHRR